MKKESFLSDIESMQKCHEMIRVNFYVDFYVEFFILNIYVECCYNKERENRERATIRKHKFARAS